MLHMEYVSHIVQLFLVDEGHYKKLYMDILKWINFTIIEKYYSICGLISCSYILSKWSCTIKLL